MRERERGGRRLRVALVFAWCLLTAARGAAEPAQGSLRLVVQPEREWVLAGGTLNVSIGLRDAHNQPSPAPTAFVIALAVSPAVVGAASTVTIPAGQSAAALQLQPSKPGILEIRATHPQAFDGGAFVRVALRAPSPKRARLDGTGRAMPATGSLRGRRPPVPVSVASGAPASRPAPSPSATPRIVPASRPTPLPSATPRATPAPPPVAGAVAPPPPSPSPPPPRLVATPSSPTVATPPVATLPSPTRSDGDPTPTRRLALRYSPHRKLLADGLDRVTIQAFVLDDDSEPAGPTDDAFKVTLFASSGTLEPLPLVIQGLAGSSTLTVNQPGDVDVEFLGSQPDAKLEGDRHLRIHFGPPIHGLRLEAKPASISLVDETELVVTLLDAGGRAVATDEPLVVVLALDTGRGEIVQEQLTVKPGEFEARTRFVATGAGDVAVSATSSSLLNQTARLNVRLPLGLLALSVVGGLVGGLLAFVRRRGTRWPRIPIGGVTGFLLYWAFMFGLMRVMPRAFVLNPLSNFALSTIGGWLGTEVFALLLNRLGLKKPTAREERDGGKPAPKPDREPTSGNA